MTVKQLTEEIRNKYARNLDYNSSGDQYSLYCTQEFYSKLVLNMMEDYRPYSEVMSKEDVIDHTKISQLQIPGIGLINFKLSDFDFKIEKIDYEITRIKR